MGNSSRKTDRTDDALRVALAAIVAEDLPQVLEDARREARKRATAALADAMTEALVDGVRFPELPRAGDPRAEEPGDALGLYLYCVTRADATIPTLTGIDPEHAPTTIEDGELAAVVSQVRLADFDEDRLRENLNDMAWLERTARSHEEVLDAVGERETLIPMRLCTMYRAESGVREMLLREQGALKDALAHLEAKSEWGVKVFTAGQVPQAPAADAPAANAPSAETADAPEAEAEDSGTSAGTAYLLGRQAERNQRDRRYDELHAACTAIHERLAAVAADAITATPQRPEVSGHAGEMLLNGVYLVEDDELTRFLAEVDQVSDEHQPLGLEIQPTGPWPAYNFVPGTIGAAW